MTKSEKETMKLMCRGCLHNFFYIKHAAQNNNAEQLLAFIADIEKNNDTLLFLLHHMDKQIFADESNRVCQHYTEQKQII